MTQFPRATAVLALAVAISLGLSACNQGDADKAAEPAGEEAAEHLIVQRVHPLAAKLDRVLAAYDRQVVLELCAPDQLVDARLQEERIAEAERRAEADAGVCREA